MQLHTGDLRADGGKVAKDGAPSYGGGEGSEGEHGGGPEKDKASSDARLNTSKSTNDNDFEKEATRSSRPTVKLVVHPKWSSSRDATARARYLVCLHLLLEEDHPSYQIHQSRSSLSDVQAIMDNLNWYSDYLHASHIPSAFLRQSQKEIAYH
eukprot:scaffold2346_cov280-Alexandrium_tamarense.AAC.6